MALVLYAPSLALNAGKNKYNKNVDIIFSAHTRFCNNLHQVHSKSTDWKTFTRYTQSQQIEKPSSGTLKVNRLKSQQIQTPRWDQKNNK